MAFVLQMTLATVRLDTKENDAVMLRMIPATVLLNTKENDAWIQLKTVCLHFRQALFVNVA